MVAARVAIGACALAAGCQEPQLDHVDGSSATFNADRIPTVDRQQSVAQTGSQKETASTIAGEAGGSATSSAAPTNDALVVESLNRGHREAALNHLEQAEIAYRRVLEIQPENSVANHRLAVIADKKRDFARAEHYYLTALHHDSRNPDLLGDLGYSYLLQGRREESERALLAATRIDPSHAKALHNLSLLYAMSGDYDRSFDALRRAVGESEARVKIARLFPNGRPLAKDGDEVIASFQPSEPSDASSPAAVEEPAAAAAPANGLQPSAPMSVTEPVATFGSADAPSTAPSAAPRPPEAPGASIGRVSDSQINEAFAAIDREAPHEPQTAAAAAPSPTPVDAALPAPAPQPSAAPHGAAPSGSDATDLQAAPGADPLASMPLWSPAATASQQRKPPAAFLFDEGAPASPHPPAVPTGPHAVPTGVLPISANDEVPRASRKGDALSEFEAELEKNKQTVSGGRTQSNAGLAREPLIAQRPKVGQDSSPDQRGTADDPSWPAPFDTAPPLHIQPRSNPAPLFQPVDGFGPANDFAPGDNAAVPAWPSTNGNPAGPNADAGQSGDAGPVIRPRSPN